MINIILGVLVPALVLAGVLIPLARTAAKRRAILRNGELKTAEILSIRQTGTMINNTPMMHLELQVPQGSGFQRRSVRHLIDLGQMPRVGERVYVMVDRSDPGRIAYVGLSPDLSSETRQDATDGPPPSPAAIAKRLLKADGYRLGIATVLDVQRDGKRRLLRLELDALAAGKRIVTAPSPAKGVRPQLGERLYVLVNDADPARVELLPPILTSGRNMPRGAGRLDPLVLGPQLLREGAIATGTVISADRVSLPLSLIDGQRGTRWQLRLRVVPHDQSMPPFEAEPLVTFTDTERADRICRENATVALRYDPDDLQTVATDPISEGLADPYLPAQAAFRQALEDAAHRDRGSPS